jgi:hypothetical protein
LIPFRRIGNQVILKLFSKEGLENLFKVASLKFKVEKFQIIRNVLLYKMNKNIDPVIAFFKGKIHWRSKFVRKISCQSVSFCSIGRTGLGFGTMGHRIKQTFGDFEDISDFIVECVDANFGFSRYAERLGRSANSFDEL